MQTMYTKHDLSERELAALAASALGRKGGKAGRGKTKARGGSEYYRGIANKRWRKKAEDVIVRPATEEEKRLGERPLAGAEKGGKQ